MKIKLMLAVLFILINGCNGKMNIQDNDIVKIELYAVTNYSVSGNGTVVEFLKELDNQERKIIFTFIKNSSLRKLAYVNKFAYLKVYLKDGTIKNWGIFGSSPQLGISLDEYSLTAPAPAGAIHRCLLNKSDNINLFKLLKDLNENMKYSFYSETLSRIEAQDEKQ